MAKTTLSREQKESLYEKVVSAHTGGMLKGATVPYTSLHGHMYSMLTKGGEVALRLPPEERTKFLEKFESSLVEQYGIVQKEYVLVPDTLLQKTAILKKYFDISIGYVRSMKPKTTAKTKKKG